jgi:hypothetical protein
LIEFAGVGQVKEHVQKMWLGIIARMELPWFELQSCGVPIALLRFPFPFGWMTTPI